MNVDTTTGGENELEFAKVLSDGTRQRLMTLCCCQWRSVGELVEELGGEVSQPTVSHHLAVLRRAGLVDVRREGRRVLYTLDQERVAMCCGRLVARFAPESEAAATLRRDGGSRLDSDRGAPELPETSNRKKTEGDT